MTVVSLQLAPVLCRVPLSPAQVQATHTGRHTRCLSPGNSVLVTSPGLCPRPAPSYITHQLWVTLYSTLAMK